MYGMSTYIAYYVTRILHVIAETNSEMKDLLVFNEPDYDTTDNHIIQLTGNVGVTTSKPTYKMKWCIKAINKQTKKVDKTITKYYQFDNPDGLVEQEFRMINRAIQIEIHKIN